MQMPIWSKWEDALGLGCITAGAAVILGYLMRPSHDGEPLDINTILEASNDMAVADFNLLVGWTIVGFLAGLAVGAFVFVKKNWRQALA